MYKRRCNQSDADFKYRQSKKGREADRRHCLKYKFGITVEQYDKLFKQQKGCCAICKRPQLGYRKRLAVDHDHKTGKVRGLLCHTCNTAFEQFVKYSKGFNRLLQVA